MVLLCAWYMLCSSGLRTRVHQLYPTVYFGTEFLSLTANVYWPTYYVMWIIAWLCKRWKLPLHLKGRCGGMGRKTLSSTLHRLQRKATKKGEEVVTDCPLFWLHLLREDRVTAMLGYAGVSSQLCTFNGVFHRKILQGAPPTPTKFIFSSGDTDLLDQD